MNPVRVTILGASGPYPGSDDLPSVLIRYGSLTILLDAGEGVQHRLLHAGVSPASVSYIFITHFHGDHILGLLPLLQSRSLAGCDRELWVFGPAGISEYLLANFRMLKFMPRYEVRVGEVSDGKSLELQGGVKVAVVGLDHVIETYGYILDFGGRVRVSYITDTRPVEGLAEVIEHSDLLIHDATFSSRDRELARNYGHSTAVDAARVARSARCSMLLLFHTSPRYRKSLNTLLAESRRVFENSWIAEKYMRVWLK